MPAGYESGLIVTCAALKLPHDIFKLNARGAERNKHMEEEIGCFLGGPSGIPFFMAMMNSVDSSPTFSSTLSIPFLSHNSRLVYEPSLGCASRSHMVSQISRINPGIHGIVFCCTFCCTS